MPVLKTDTQEAKRLLFCLGMEWRLRGGLLLLLLATVAVAGDSGGGPAAPPKKPPLPKTARPAAAGTAGASAPLKPAAEPEGDPAAALRSSSKTSTLAMTRLVVRALAVAQPYLRNPLRIPPRIGAAATLFVLSFWFLFGAVTSLLRLLLKPADFAVNLCLGSALHYAALVALRGVGRQLQLMATAERLPFTMVTE